MSKKFPFPLPDPSTKVFCGHCWWEGTYGETHPEQPGYCPKCGAAIWSDGPGHRDIARRASEPPPTSVSL